MIRVQLTIGARAWDITTGIPQPGPGAAPVVLDGTTMAWRYASEDEWPSALEPLQATVKVAAYDVGLFADVTEGDPATVRFLTPAGETIGAVYGQVADADATQEVRTLNPDDPAATVVLTTWTLNVVDHKGTTLAYQVVKGTAPAGVGYDRMGWLAALTIEHPSWLPGESAADLLFDTSGSAEWAYAAVDYTKGATVVGIVEAWAAENGAKIGGTGTGAPAKPAPYQGATVAIVAVHPGSVVDPVGGEQGRTRATLAELWFPRNPPARLMPATLTVVNQLLTITALPDPVDHDVYAWSPFPGWWLQGPAITSHPGVTTRGKVVPASRIELGGGKWRMDRSRGNNAATVTGNGNVSATTYREDYTPATANMRTVSTTMTVNADAAEFAALHLFDPMPFPWDRESFTYRPDDPAELTHDSWFPDLRANHPRVWGQGGAVRTPGCFGEPVAIVGVDRRWNLGNPGSLYAGTLQRCAITVEDGRYRVDFGLRRYLARPRPDTRQQLTATAAGDPGAIVTGGYEARVSWLKTTHPTVRLRAGAGPKVDPGLTLYDMRLVRTPTEHA